MRVFVIVLLKRCILVTVNAVCNGSEFESALPFTVVKTEDPIVLALFSVGAGCSVLHYKPCL